MLNFKQKSKWKLRKVRLKTMFATNLRRIKFRHVLISLIVILIGVSVFTGTPPFVVINKKVHFVFTRKLNLYNKISDKDIKALKHMQWVESLITTESGISNLSMLKEMVNLKKLNVETCYGAGLYIHTQITDISDIKYLINLEEFYVYGKDISDISSIKYCKRIKDLALLGTDCEDYSALFELPKLKSLSIDKGVLTREQIKMLEEKGVEIYEYDAEKNRVGNFY